MRNTYINLKLRAIGIFYGGIIALDPLIVDELGCSRMSLVLQRGRQGSMVGLRMQRWDAGAATRRTWDEGKVKAKATATAMALTKGE